ncbi:DUF4153 domain-containing protein [Flavisphingomonas formosensis]|uniref:DUF4153 domain-containing protein n=1 Tax=Flavisphingomonas formosensis TaxID=861534 RepID=UPI0012FAA4A1|nr:DUF4173 domain-containing protein [Sphingomonas formosensis]
MFRISYSFWRKAAGAILLAIVADILFLWQGSGSTIGLFGLLHILVLILALPAARGDRGSQIAFLVALLMSAAQIEEPTLLGCLIGIVAGTLAVLMPRQRFDDAFLWMQRLFCHVALGIPHLFRDVHRLLHLPRLNGRFSARAATSLLALPILGGFLFVLLFADANPIIGQAIATVPTPSAPSILTHVCFCLAVLLLIWPSLRPHPRVTGLFTDIARPDLAWLQVPVPSLLLSLVTFNLIFAIQNALDLLFLWSGAPLPGTITLAGYAHRGAYTLICTVLLAALFVLALLRPDTKAARNPAIRSLLVLWIGQNLLLVASSILRTWDYVQSFSLTLFRISALLWMALVAIGLLLVCWRLLAGHSARWLINANALAAAIVLTGFSLADVDAISARWNVGHAREMGGRGQPLDLCYLRDLGASALLPLIDVERHAPQTELRDRAAAIRVDLLAGLAARQADWHQWTWRGARRLAAARAALGPHPLVPRAAPYGRDCDGSIVRADGEDA